MSIKRDIGRAGENRFSELCNHVSLAVNPSSQKDVYGWDFLVEFPNSESGCKSLDEMPSPIECKVQVKSTEKYEKKLAVKLSVLYRLVKTHLPSFLLFFEYGKSENPEAAYLYHIDKLLIEKVLKRVRELEVEGRANAINKRTITIHYGEEIRFLDVTGQCLKRAIELYIPEGLDVYTTDKLKLLKELGYDEFSHRGNITFYSKDHRVQDELVDLFIGKRDEIDIIEFELFSSRFGIDLPIQKFSDLGSGKLSLPDMKPSFRGAVYFKEDKYAAPVEFDADFYTLPTGLNVSLDKMKFRAETDFFELVFRPGALDYEFKQLGAGDDMPLGVFFNRFWFLDRISKGGKLVFGFVRNGDYLDLGDTNTVPQNLGDLSEILALTEKAIEICGKLRIKTDKVLVNYDGLIAFSRRIEHLHGLMFPPVGKFRLVIPFENNPKKEDLINLAMVIGGWARIGSAFFAYTYAVLLDPHTVIESEEGFEVFSEKTKLAPVKYGTYEDISKLNINVLKEEFSNELESEGKKVFLYDQK